MSELLCQLSENAHIKLRNRFTGFFALAETTMWELEAEHCFHRGHFFRGKSNTEGLNTLITQAITEMSNIEQRYADKKLALSILYPQLDDYQLADMATNFE